MFSWSFSCLASRLFHVCFLVHRNWIQNLIFIICLILIDCILYRFLRCSKILQDVIYKRSPIFQSGEIQFENWILYSSEKLNQVAFWTMLCLLWINQGRCLPKACSKKDAKKPRSGGRSMNEDEQSYWMNDYGWLRL